jgi:hypothetical protein
VSKRPKNADEHLQVILDTVQLRRLEAQLGTDEPLDQDARGLLRHLVRKEMDSIGATFDASMSVFEKARHDRLLAIQDTLIGRDKGPIPRRKAIAQEFGTTHHVVRTAARLYGKWAKAEIQAAEKAGGAAGVRELGNITANLLTHWARPKTNRGRKPARKALR